MIFFRIILSLLVTLIASIPVDLAFSIYKFANPGSFIEKFLMLGLGIWVFGGMQFFFFIIWLFSLYEIWKAE